MKKWMNFKTANFIWNIALAVLAVVYLFRLFLPADIQGMTVSSMTFSSNNDLLAITPTGALVRINDGGGAVPYLLRSTVLKHVKAVSASGGAVMAVDENGRLWGWKSSRAYSVLSQTLTDKPAQLLEGVQEVTVGDSFAVAVTEDNRLLVLDNQGNCVPCMEGHSVKACRSVNGCFYVITSDNDLYRFSSEEDLRFDRIGEPIAAGVRDVGGAGLTAQCLMEDGTVRLLSDELTLEEPIYEGAAALCVGGIINSDGELLIWRKGTQNNDAMVLQLKDTHVAAAYSETLYLKNNGRMYWNGMLFPASVNTLSPVFRNLLCGWAAVKVLLWWGKRRSERK